MSTPLQLIVNSFQTKSELILSDEPPDIIPNESQV